MASGPTTRIVAAAQTAGITRIVAADYKARAHHYQRDNWSRYALGTRVFEGFALHQWAGTMLDTSNGREAWFWSARGDGALPGWGNLVEGIRFNQNAPTWPVLGTWASTGWPTSVSAAGEGDLTPYHDLRSFTTATTMLTQQGLRAVTLPSGQVVLVLGCPGGRVRVVQPGVMRTTDALTSGASHGLGSVEETPFDLGYGGSALAVRPETNGTITIWFGTIYGPTKPPAGYGNASGTLTDDEVACGAVHKFTWTPGSAPNGFPAAPAASRRFTPASGERGGYGVVGIHVADLLPNAVHPGDEVIVATLSGDLFVLDENLSTVLWRSHVTGGVGAYNSIRVEDLNGDGHKELYVAGSLGLWRFIQAGEPGFYQP